MINASRTDSRAEATRSDELCGRLAGRSLEAAQIFKQIDAKDDANNEEGEEVMETMAVGMVSGVVAGDSPQAGMPEKKMRWEMCDWNLKEDRGAEASRRQLEVNETR